MTTRYAVYYAPALDDPLWAAGCAWLGGDPAGGEPGSPPPIEGLGAITADARGYGFHATLKPPMRLREGATRAGLMDAMTEVAACVPAFPLPPLAVADAGGFLCLRETRDSPALQALCDATVAGLDHLRADLSDAELARRRAARLSPVREANLRRWGYPDVFATWAFHMTLSRRLDAEEMALLRPAAETWFAPSLRLDRIVRDLCLYEQEGAGPFRLTARVALAERA